MGHLKDYLSLEHAIFDELRHHIRLNLRRNKGGSRVPQVDTKTNTYVLYAPSGVNYKVKAKKPRYGKLSVERFEDKGVWYQYGVGDLYLKNPEKLAKKNVVYWNVPEVNGGGVFVAYENILDDSSGKKPVLRVDRLKHRDEKGGQYERIAQIPLNYLYDWRQQKSDPIYVTDGWLDGIQEKSFSSDNAGIYKDKALMNLVRRVLVTENVYKWPLKGDKSTPDPPYKENANGIDAFF